MMWVPTHANGYTAAEMRDKAATGSLIGVSKWELDTPALCVDLDKLDQNLATMQKKLAATGVASRPHAKTHKCPEIARRQVDADIGPVLDVIARSCWELADNGIR